MQSIKQFDGGPYREKKIEKMPERHARVLARVETHPFFYYYYFFLCKGLGLKSYIPYPRTDFMGGGGRGGGSAFRRTIP